MKFYKPVLLGLSLLAPLASQADIKSASAEGYLSRGVAMYNIHNYSGAIDQLTHLSGMPVDANTKDCAELYIALSKYERGMRKTPDALLKYIKQHPGSPNTDKVWATIGDHYFFHGKYGDAIRYYDKVRTSALDDNAQEDLYYRRAYSLLRLGEYKQARIDINVLSGTKRYANAYTFYQAYIDYAEGRYNEAAQKFRQVGRAGELGYNAQYYMCQIYFLQNEYEQTQTLAKALLADGNNTYFNNELSRIIGECQYQEGNDEEAAVNLKRYLDSANGEPIRSAAYAYGVIQYRNANFDEAVDYLSQTTSESDAISQNAYLYIGQCRLQSGQLNQASMAFEKAIQLDFNRDVTETAYYNYAIAQNEGGRTPFNKAIDIYEQFINSYPNSRYTPKVEEYLINAYMTTTDFNKAYNSIKHIKNPSNKVLAAKQYVLYQLGVEALANNNQKLAKSHLTEALALENHNKVLGAETRLWLGECVYRNGEYSNAENYQKAFIKGANANSSNIGLGYYNLGYSQFQQKKYADAAKNFSHAADNAHLAAGLKADALNRLGDCLHYSGQYSEAKSKFNEAYKLDKTNGDYALFQSAMMQGLCKEHNAKINSINSFIKEFPNSSLVPSAMLEKANTYALLKNNKQATAAYNELIAKHPATQEARKGLLQLAINELNAGEQTNAITTYKQVITKYPTSEEAKIASEDLKLIYAERGTLNEYVDFINNVPNAPQLDIAEVERLTYAAAEKDALAENSNLTKMKAYLKSYPEGAFVANAHYYIGRELFQKKNYDEALKNIDIALEAGDASFAEDALAIKSEIYIKQNRNTEALNIYRLLESKSSSTDNKIIAHLGIMRASKDLQLWDDVKQSAAALLSLGGLTAQEEKETILNRAIANAKLGNTKDAENDYATLAKDTRSEFGAQAAYCLAELQFKNGNNKAAEKTLNKIIDDGTPHQYWLAKSFILLADIYYKQGNKFEAIEYMESLKANYPGSEADIISDINSRIKKWKTSK